MCCSSLHPLNFFQVIAFMVAGTLHLAIFFAFGRSVDVVGVFFRFFERALETGESGGVIEAAKGFGTFDYLIF